MALLQSFPRSRSSIASTCGQVLALVPILSVSSGLYFNLSPSVAESKQTEEVHWSF